VSIRIPGAKVSMPRCGSGYRRGRHCWTPATSITACFCPSCYTVAMIRAVRCLDRHEVAARPGAPTPIFQPPSKPCANTGCRSATLADHRRRGSSYRLLPTSASMIPWKPLWTLAPGSRLDADHPENGVLIPRRNTIRTQVVGPDQGGDRSPRGPRTRRSRWSACFRAQPHRAPPC